MLIRICLIAVIVGSFATIGFDLALMNKKINAVMVERDQFRSKRDREASAKLAAQRLVNETQARLKATASELDETQAQRDRERVIAVQLSEKNLGLTEKLATAQTELHTASERLASWDALGLTVERAVQIKSEQKALKEELEAVGLENTILHARTGWRFGPDVVPDGPPLMPAGFTGTVVAYDPKFDFVVLNIGERQGVLENGELLVYRRGKLLAKVKVTNSLQSDLCIANVMPRWKLGEITEGDEVITR